MCGWPGRCELILLIVFSCDQAALWMVFSVRLSVRPSVTPFWLCSHHRIIMKFSGVITKDQGKVHAKGQGQGQRSRSQRSQPNLTVSGLQLQFEVTYDKMMQVRLGVSGYEIMHKAWSSIVEVLYCFSRSSVKFQGHMALKIVEFDPDWAFPDCNSSLNSPMGTKWCTKLEVA